MSKREEHVFTFTAGEIAKAATAEAAYHTERVAWWGGEFETAMATAKEKGVEIRAYDVTGGKRAEIVIDPGLNRRIQEASSKRDEHHRQADRFTIEAAAYGSQPVGREYELDAADVVYFRLAGGPRVDENNKPFV